MVGLMSGKFPDQTPDNKSIPTLLATTFTEKQGIPSGSTGVAVFGPCASGGAPFAAAMTIANGDLSTGEGILNITDSATQTARATRAGSSSTPWAPARRAAPTFT